MTFRLLPDELDPLQHVGDVINPPLGRTELLADHVEVQHSVRAVPQHVCKLLRQEAQRRVAARPVWGCRLPATWEKKERISPSGPLNQSEGIWIGGSNPSLIFLSIAQNWTPPKSVPVSMYDGCRAPGASPSGCRKPPSPSVSREKTTSSSSLQEEQNTSPIHKQTAMTFDC